MRLLVVAGLLAGLVASPASAASVFAQAGLGTQVETVSSSSGPGFTSAVSASKTIGPASAWSSSNLESGVLRGGLNTVLNTPEDVRMGGGFDASFGDRFDFTLAGVGADDVTTLYLKIHFDAETQFGGSVELHTTIDSTAGGLGLQQNKSDLFMNYYTFTSYVVAPGPNLNQDLTSTLVKPGNSVAHGTYDLLLPFQIKGSSGYALFSSAASGKGDPNGNSRLDFGNSAHFSFLLPETVTFTSGSGNAFTAPVPEPASWALMITGFGLTGAMLRRRGGARLAA